MPTVKGGNKVAIKKSDKALIAVVLASIAGVGLAHLYNWSKISSLAYVSSFLLICGMLLLIGSSIFALRGE